MKYCPKCETEKPRDEFGNDRSRPDGKFAYCKSCASRHQAKLYRADPAKTKARTSKWQKANRDKVRKSWLARRDKVAERARHRKRYASRTSEQKARDRERLRRYARKNRSLLNDREAIRRAQKKATDVEGVTREGVYSRDEGRCVHCGKELLLAEMHLDHLIPLSKLGGHTWLNCATACAGCNLSKGSKLPKAAA